MQEMIVPVIKLENKGVQLSISICVDCMTEKITKKPEDTFAYGKELAKQLKSGDIVASSRRPLLSFTSLPGIFPEIENANRDVY